MENNPPLRPASRNADRENALTKVTSGNHLDDHSHYVHHHNTHENAMDSELDDISSGSEKDNDLSPGETDADGRIVSEVVDGIEVQRDVEGTAGLEKSRTGKSSKRQDPNLVAWEGPDDPLNPKNWSTRRKWAATFVGKFLDSGFWILVM